MQNAPGLPKTRSGKIMRRVLKKIANDDHELGDISTMADGSVVEVDVVLEVWHLYVSFLILNVFQVLFNCREEMMQNKKNK